MKNKSITDRCPWTNSLKDFSGLIPQSDEIKNRFNKILRNKRFTMLRHILPDFFMFCWISLLYYTDSYFIIYLAIAIGGFSCRRMMKNNTAAPEKALFPDRIAASVFSLMVTLANYNLPQRMLHHIVSTYHGATRIEHYSLWISLIVYLILFVGGTCLFHYLLSAIACKIDSVNLRMDEYKVKPQRFFIGGFLGLSIFYSAVMLLCFYPGVTTTDSVQQIKEILSGNYTNHHPFFHTLIIRFFLHFGKLFSDNINTGIMLYSLASILFVSAVFSYMITTLYQLKLRRSVLIATFLFYLLLPAHIMNSFTMWKDIPFSAVVLLFTVSFFRFMSGTGHHRKTQIAILILSAFGFCLLRNNGLIAFFIVTIAFAVIYRNKRSHPTVKGLLMGMIGLVVICYILVNPVLNAFGIEKTETVESLSIPIQQVSRTVIDNNDLTEKQKDLITKQIDIEKIHELYTPYISDPVKFYIRDYGDQAYFNEHKMQYALLYVQLGISHPGSYVKAWVDQTKGYWNAGYDYARYSTVCDGGELGITREAASPKLQRMVLSYFSLYNYIDLLKPFQSIGLFTWLTLLVLYIGIKKKNKLTVFLTVPCVALILTLLIATPVFAEFRYSYAVFCCLPFLGAISFVNDNKQSDLEVL